MFRVCTLERRRGVLANWDSLTKGLRECGDGALPMTMALAWPRVLGIWLSELAALDPKGRKLMGSMVGARVILLDDPQDREPFLAFAEEVPPNVYQEGLPMPLNVLACDPGVCSVFEWLRADPEPGSEAYARLGRTLADPELIARQAPIGQMSLAVKMVKVVDPAADRPENPTLDAVGRGGLPEMAAFEWVWRIERGGLVSANEAPTGDTGDYRYGYDPEPQPTVGQVASRVPDWSVRVGYTAGRILEQTFDGQELFFAQRQLLGGPAPVRRFLPDLIDQVLRREINPGKVFDLHIPLEDVAEGYRAMDERRAIKTLLRV